MTSRSWSPSFAFTAAGAAALAACLLFALASCSPAPRQGGDTALTDPAPAPPTSRPYAVFSSADVPATQRAQLARDLGYAFPPAPPLSRDEAQAAAGSASCRSCHVQTDSHSMHKTPVGLSCVDCHGGHPDIAVPVGITRATDPARYDALQRQAHVTPTVPELWPTSANPSASGAATLREGVDFIRFVNPGDLRAAPAACASCHPTEVDRVSRSMMSHGGMLWQAALYNNGAVNRKQAIFGESYAINGQPRALSPMSAPTTRQVQEQGHLPQLLPLPRWEVSQPGNILRVFERGAKRRPIIGVPEVDEDPGRPDVKLSVRGLGTDVRTDPVFLGVQKTRLLDPTLNLTGTNDHPGDYRASGCSACHVVYANDSSPVHSAYWSGFGNRGKSASADPTVPRDQSGHPIKHSFVRNMPTSQCIVCHVHPGTSVLNSYLGYLWWDNESDGEFMYPRQQKYPTAQQEALVRQHNPEGSAARGLWSNLYPGEQSHAGLTAGADFLGDLSALNPSLRHNYFADFHGHGWVFRAVFKQDRKGNLLDTDNNIVQSPSAQQRITGAQFQWRKPGDRPAPGTPVHLKDIHLEKGMACVDCHFSQDSHGDGNLYGENRNAVMVDCIDCHGTPTAQPAIAQYLKLPRGKRAGADGKSLLARAFTGNAAPRTVAQAELAGIKKLVESRFELSGDALVQKSALAADAPTPADPASPPAQWTLTQVQDTAGSSDQWAKSAGVSKRGATLARYAHTIRRDGKTWGDLPADPAECARVLAHSPDRVSCYACHTSWNTSCFGCHLPMKANVRSPMLHNEGTPARNYTSYNFQTLRDDVYMLGIDSAVKGGKIVPVRSACAVLVSSQDANRQWIYAQQQTVSAEGFAGTAFSPYFPHTVRATETKQCSDCHVSKNGDNNAVMAQLLLQGTNSVNFVGRFAYVATGKGGLVAAAVTERDEPQAVFGSRLHELAYPDDHRKHLAAGRQLSEWYDHHGEVLDVQLRGEYVYAACGPEGFIAYDVANIDNKGFSERIVTAPVSPLGQKFYIPSKFATSICSPSTLAIDPTRPRRADNREGPIHLLYAFLYLTDREEGLIVIGNPLDDRRNKPGVATLLDGDPSNNYLRRAATFNPDGLLNGARRVDLCGTFAYVSCDTGLVVVDLADPVHPAHITTLPLRQPRRVAFQFRYGFVCDAEGVKVIDVTDPAKPRLTGASIPLADARDIYVSRTFGYVAAGRDGLVILDLERPESPKVDQTFTADPDMRAAGDALDDTTAVRVGMTNVSMFAYVADGRNGLRVLQLTSARDGDGTPGFMGFSPKPAPRQVARLKTKSPAVSISEGLDRDRAVDESGNQLSVFGRNGARPLNRDEQRRLYLKPAESPASSPQLYTVSDDPETSPLQATTQPAAAPATEPAPPPRRRFPAPRTGG